MTPVQCIGEFEWRRSVFHGDCAVAEIEYVKLEDKGRVAGQDEDV